MVTVKIKRSFGRFLNFEQGQVREFTEAELVQFEHMVERGQENSVNSLDDKPDKKYKRGRKKG